MNSQNIMQIILIAILLLCGYFYLFQAVAKRTANRAALPVIAILLLFIYAGISVSLILVIGRTSSMDFVFMALLILISFIGLSALALGLVRNFRALNRTALTLFILYLLMLGYVTIFSRSERRTTEVLLRFDSVEESIRKRSLEPLEHLWLNVVMFVPMGLLFPAIDDRLNKLMYVLPLGLITSTIIETTQLLMRLGQCDLEDLAANTLGACIGLLCFRLYRRFRPA